MFLINVVQKPSSAQAINYYLKKVAPPPPRKGREKNVCVFIVCYGNLQLQFVPFIKKCNLIYFTNANKVFANNDESAAVCSLKNVY